MRNNLFFFNLTNKKLTNIMRIKILAYDVIWIAVVECPSDVANAEFVFLHLVTKKFQK